MTGRGLQAWREQNGFSQLDLAQALRVSIDTIIHWEREVGSKKLPPYLQVQLNALLLKKAQPAAADTPPIKKAAW